MSNSFIKLGNSEKTIVFLPGGNIDIRCYLPLLKKISSKYTIYAVDLLNINSNSIEETKSWVKEFVLDLNQENIILVGHSFGADMIKSIELNCVAKCILLNSSIIKIHESKLNIIIKVIINSIIGGFKYPKLFTHYLQTNFYLTLNLMTRPINTFYHIKQALLNVAENQIVTVKSNKNIIVSSKNDYLFPISQIPEEKLKDILIVEGNHNWLMEDINNSSSFILNIINTK